MTDTRSGIGAFRARPGDDGGIGRTIGVGSASRNDGSFQLTVGRSGDRFTGLLRIGRDNGRTNVGGSLFLRPDRDRHRHHHDGYRYGAGHYYHGYNALPYCYSPYDRWNGYVYTSVYYREPVIYRYYESQPVYVDTVYEPSVAAPAVIVPDGVAVSPAVGADAAPYFPIEPSPQPLIEQGADAFAAGRYDEASSLFTQSVLADERDGYAKLLLAMSHFATRDYDVSAVALRRALLTTDVLIDEPLDVRTLYEDVGRFRSQMADLAGAVARRPWSNEAQLLLGYLHYATGDPGAAEAILERVVRNDAQDELAKRLLAAVREVARAVAAP